MTPSTRVSPTRLATRAMSRSWLTRSKNFARSRSATQTRPFLTWSLAACTACHALRPGLEAVARFAEPALENRLQDLQHRLLNQPVYHRRHAQCSYPTRGFGDVHRSHFPWQVAARQQRRLHCGPVSLQPRLQVRYPHAIGTRRALVAQLSLVSPPHVAALDHLLHELRGHFRFGSPRVAVAASAPPLAPVGFRPPCSASATSGWVFPERACASSSSIEITGPTRVLSCSALRCAAHLL